MRYQYAIESQDYTDYASGAVFYSAPGHPAFPIRLTSEIFQRALALRASCGAHEPPVLYDPCCGAAYHLSTLAYHHGSEIARIIASDIDTDILDVARRNLGLLTLKGLDRRIEEIQDMLTAYGKPSHDAALASARRLRRALAAFTAERALPTCLFRADALNATEVALGLAETRVDIVLSDIPYGQHATWQSADPVAPPERPVWQMLEALRPALAEGAVIALAADKGQALEHEAYRRVARFRIGKRQVALLQSSG